MSSDEVKNTNLKKDASVKAPKANRRKSRLITYVVVTVLVVLAAVAVPYFMWYQNPNKVVADGVLNALNSKTVKANGDITYSNDQYKITTAIDGQSNRISGMLNVKLALENKKTKTTINTVADGVLADNGDLYVKVNDSKDIFSAIGEAAISSLQASPSQTGQASPEAIAGYRAMVSEIYKPISKQVDGQWIKIPANTVNPFSQQANNAQKCLTEAGKLAQNDSQALREVIDAYSQHEFIAIDDSLGSNGNEVGYKVKIDQQKAGDFATAFSKSKIGEKVESCVKSDSPLGGSNAKDSKKIAIEDPVIELWINRWNHEIKRVKSTANNNTASVDLKTDFNAGVSIEVPKDSKTLQDVIDGLAGVK